MDSRKPQDIGVESLEDYIKSWPHYENAHMLMYEYSLKEKIKLETLYQNASAFLIRLQQHFNETNDLSCIETLQERLTPAKFKTQKIKPLISLIEGVHADGDPDILDDAYEERAPHLIVTTDYDEVGERVPAATVLKLTKNCDSICSKADPATIIVLSMAPYYVFNLDFPPAYESLMRLLEDRIHGSLSSYMQKKRSKLEYKSFVAEFGK